jgi:predicted nucleic acid-binding protein
MRGIADTGFLVAFGNRNDQHHGWAVALAQEVTDPLLTCEAVLAEAAFHLGDARLVLHFVEAGLVKPSFELAQHTRQIGELAERYRDRKPDLADLCLIRMSELHPNHSVITTDLAAFRAYRRNRRQVIPLIHPRVKRQTRR